MQGRPSSRVTWSAVLICDFRENHTGQRFGLALADLSRLRMTGGVGDGDDFSLDDVMPSDDPALEWNRNFVTGQRPKIRFSVHHRGIVWPKFSLGRFGRRLLHLLVCNELK